VSPSRIGRYASYTNTAADGTPQRGIDSAFFSEEYLHLTTLKIV
jgi:hypothetical protein